MATCSIVVDKTLCKGCGYCISICPKKVLGLSEEPDIRGFKVAQVLHPDECICCRQCEYICPEMAISVNNLKKEKEGIS